MVGDLLSATFPSPLTIAVMSQFESESLSIDLSKYPKLSSAQVGHLRHFHNLAFQPDGEWYHMGAQEPAQEFLDAYRYQLATVAYAVGVTHYHRLPVARTIFKPLLRQLIHKMLRREVWGYWFNTSLSGNRTDPSLKELRKPWADPVVRENIMYSGHLLLMTSLYAMLFDDDEFEKPESLVFNWNPIFFGFGPEIFTYDNRSLQKAVTDEMERNGWVGVCCEPNLVFVVCNQFPVCSLNRLACFHLTNPDQIIAMRYNDSRDGTTKVDEVLTKYKAAWDKKGMVTPSGLFVDMWVVKQDILRPAGDVGWTAWAGAFMNSWNTDLIKSLYPKQAHGFITNLSGRIRLQPPSVANHFRKLTAETPSMSEKEALSKAILISKEELSSDHKPPFPYTKPTFGYAVQWLSELGRAEELKGLLAYADTYLDPTWENGGLYYPRNDTPFVFDDGDGEGVRWTHMDPFSGNAAIGYARLNVPNGQREMYESPWTRKSLSKTPWIDNIHFVHPEQGVSILRGLWDEHEKALILTVKGWNFEGSKCNERATVTPVARGLENGSWRVYVRGKLAEVKEIKDGEGLKANAEVLRGEEVDFAFVKACGHVDRHTNGDV